MKTQIKTLLVCLLFGATALGQAKKELTKEQKIDNKVEHLTKKLKLDDQQKLLVKQEVINLQSQLQGLKPTKEQKEAMKVERENQKLAIKAEIESVLTEDQQQKLADLESKKESKKHPKHHNKKRVKGADLTDEEKATKKVERLDKKLDLSEKQESKIKEMHLKHMQASKAKKEELKQNKQALKSKRDEILSTHHVRMKEILNEKQDEQYDKMLAKRKEKQNTKRGK